MACNLDLQPISLIWEEFLGRTPICTLDILVINSDQIKVSAGQYHATILWALVFTSLRSHAQMLVSVRMQPRKDCYSWGRGGVLGELTPGGFISTKYERVDYQFLISKKSWKN